MEVKKHIEIEAKPKKKKITVEVKERGRKVTKVVEVEEPQKPVKKVVTEMQDKDVLFVNDIKPYFANVFNKRGILPAKGLIRIGLDGGKGSFKVMASVCKGEEEEAEEEEEEEVGARKVEDAQQLDDTRAAFDDDLLTGLQLVCP